MIHGSLNKPGDNSVDTVYGEVEINNRILSLNFKDCHAKIRQVDSLETLDKGVVVQVSGELSNNGQPMRRFFQTFVLAPRSPTNYYVRNDIFRYQDEPSTKSDDDDNGDLVERRIESDVPEMVQQESQQPQSVAVHQPHPTPETFPALHASSSKESNTGLPNGHVDSSHDFATSAMMIENEWDPNQTESENKMDETSAPAPVTQPSGPISWASIIKKQDPETSGSSFISSNCSNLKPVVSSEAGVHVSCNLSPILPSNPISSSQPAGKSPKGNDSNNRSNRRLRKQENRESTPGAVENQTSVDLGDSPSTVSSKKNANSGTNSTGVFADDQQVFVGNLPQDITEDTLRQFFSKYGSILDVRINRTNQQKNSNTRTPNYGFVTFDKVEIVQSILRQKVSIKILGELIFLTVIISIQPIYFNEHRFNVEEKRSQGRAVGKGGQDGNAGRRNDRNSEGPRAASGNAGRDHRGDYAGGQRKDRGNRDKPSFSDRKDEQQRRNTNSHHGNGNVNSGGRGVATSGSGGGGGGGGQGIPRR